MKRPGFALRVVSVVAASIFGAMALASPSLAQAPVDQPSRVIAVEPTGQGGASPTQASPIPGGAAQFVSAPSANVGNPDAQSGPEQRVALVIGNSAYENVPKLANPANDVAAISQLLTAAGFDTISAVDLDHDEMIQVIQDFAAKIAAKGENSVAMVYYAGHGVQVAGDNYLVPVDAKISSEADLQASGIRLVDIMATLQAVESRMRIVIVDACRNNPFPGLADVSQGLAIVDAPNGSIVGYSTAPGELALDGATKYSPYASAFLRLARQPNVPIEQFFKRVRLLVNDATDGKQTPWESSSLTSDFYFFGDTKVAAAKNIAAKTYQPPKPAYAVADVRSRPPREAYDMVIAEDRVEYYEEFVRIYPADPLAIHIRRLLAGLQQANAWHKAVLQNSPYGYQQFYNQYGSSQYGQAAQKLIAQPKPIPVYQPTKIIVPPQMVPQIKVTTIGPNNIPGGNNPGGHAGSDNAGAKGPQGGIVTLPPGGVVQPGLPKNTGPIVGSPNSNNPSASKGAQNPQGTTTTLPKGGVVTVPNTNVGTNAANAGVGAAANTNTPVRPTPPPGVSLLKTPPASATPTASQGGTQANSQVNPGGRVVTLNNGSQVQVGPGPRPVTLPPQKVTNLPARPVPQIQQPNIQQQPANAKAKLQRNPSQRFQPATRLQVQQQTTPRVTNRPPNAAVQFRGPRMTASPQTGGRACATINGSMVCR